MELLDKTVTVERAAEELELMVEDCVQNGARYTITQDGKPLAMLIPAAEYEHLDWLARHSYGTDR